MADISHYIRKLAHPIVEIRTRALHSLLQKVEFGLVSQAELSNTHPALVPHLLKLLHLGPPSVTPQLLTLLLFLAEDEGSKAMLAGPRVWQQLWELHAVAPVNLLPQVTLLLKKLGHVVYGCLAEQGEDAWQLQGPACDFLHSLTLLLTSCVNHFMDPHTQPGSDKVVSATSSGVTGPSNLTWVSCCSLHSQTAAHGDSRLHDPLEEAGHPQPFSGVGQELLGLTVHEQDDGDEFILLGLHQVTVPDHCVQVMRVACSLLASHRPSLQLASLRLMACSLALLRNCILPDLLWKLKEEGEDEEEPLVTEVMTGVQMVVGTLSDLILGSLEARKEIGAERWVLIGHCCSLYLCHTLTTLVPVEAAAQELDDVCEAVVMVLFDGGFFLQHPKQHHFLVQYLTQVNATAADEVRCLLFAAKSLHATSSFLQAPDSDPQAFLDLAEKALPSCSVLQDDAFLERLV